jgi:protein arginine kinase
MRDSQDLKSDATESWYTKDGPESDVVLSTKIRVARNLATFPFPDRLRPQDKDRVRSIVFNAFGHLEGCEDYQAVAVQNLDPLGLRILEERGSFPKIDNAESLGVILRGDGKISCVVNVIDHIRTSVYSSGLDVEETMHLSQKIDRGLQSMLQFAASYDFGYLTASVLDAGSGMRISVRMHLPSLSYQGKIKSVMESLNEDSVMLKASFGSGGVDNVSGTGNRGMSLGSFYDICNIDCSGGSEIDQMTSILASAKRLMELERQAREECKENLPTIVSNYLYRSISLARWSSLVPLREAVSIISGVKWGKDMNLLVGIDDAELHALLYRIQEGHLTFVQKNGEFHFKKDIQGDDVKKNERLRALILQESFENIKLNF